MDVATLLDPFQETLVPLGDWVAALLAWVVEHYRPVFQALKQPVAGVLDTFEAVLRQSPPLLVMAAFGFVGWQSGGPRTSAVAVACLVAIGLIGAWDPAMTTLAIILTAVSFCLLIGIPLGILAARSDRFEAVLKPILDFMQTIPSFVYLVPVVMLFGIGNVPGVIVTIFYAIAPIIRLTNLGIRQVRGDLVEAAYAFGGSPNQILFKVQMPLALPTIMTGVNQTIMMSLAMVVIASMIGVKGLGQPVLKAITNQYFSMGLFNGLAIVAIAIIFDRVSQAYGLRIQ